MCIKSVISHLNVYVAAKKQSFCATNGLHSCKVQLLVTSQDVDNYKQIKQDLDQLRSIVEKSELWVYKGQGPDETMDGVQGENEHKKKEVIRLCLLKFMC